MLTVVKNLFLLKQITSTSKLKNYGRYCLQKDPRKVKIYQLIQ
jgi:hypothetical protein